MVLRIDHVDAKTGKALAAARLEPSVITLARSATSGFVPPDKVDAIEEAVGRMLLRLYPGLRLE